MAEILGVEEASAQTGVPISTIYDLRRRPEFVALRNEKKDDVAADMWAAMQSGVARIAELLPETKDIAKVAVTVGVLYDKYALLTGQATARTEHVDIADEPSINEAISAAEGVYLRVVEKPPAVGGSHGAGPSSNGHSALRAVQLPSQAPNGHKPPKAGAEGSSNGHLPDGGDRGTVAS